MASQTTNENVMANYESIESFANDVYQKGNAYFGRKLIESEMDTTSTIAANKNAHGAHEDDSKLIVLLKQMATAESTNIKNIGNEFNGVDQDLSKYYDEKFGQELQGAHKEG